MLNLQLPSIKAVTSQNDFFVSYNAKATFMSIPTQNKHTIVQKLLDRNELTSVNRAESAAPIANKPFDNKQKVKKTPTPTSMAPDVAKATSAGFSAEATLFLYNDKASTSRALSLVLTDVCTEHLEERALDNTENPVSPELLKLRRTRMSFLPLYEGKGRNSIFSGQIDPGGSEEWTFFPKCIGSEGERRSTTAIYKTRIHSDVWCLYFSAFHLISVKSNIVTGMENSAAVEFGLEFLLSELHDIVTMRERNRCPVILVTSFPAKLITKECRAKSKQATHRNGKTDASHNRGICGKCSNDKGYSNTKSSYQHEITKDKSDDGFVFLVWIVNHSSIEQMYFSSLDE
ncbi:hypothetical protein M513_12624 [Trichuris suis]|uniref:Uncharacterized protein n=1 Tax=Trichuris suis TaxID=68888 RepID=A0A085LNG4_9BILA|nr:hypothetical protein M513_12624 [Trichuris suis]